MAQDARVDGVLTALRAAWLAQPDARLGQLLLHALSLDRPTSDPHASLLNVEDDELVAALHSVTPATSTSDSASPWDTVRLTANIPKAAAGDLMRASERAGYNRVTTLVRAIRVFDALLEAEAAGGSAVITYRDGRRERLLPR